jgi:hypothetical protein
MFSERVNPCMAWVAPLALDEYRWSRDASCEQAFAALCGSAGPSGSMTRRPPAQRAWLKLAVQQKSSATR